MKDTPKNPEAHETAKRAVVAVGDGRGFVIDSCNYELIKDFTST